MAFAVGPVAPRTATFVYAHHVGCFYFVLWRASNHGNDGVATNANAQLLCQSCATFAIERKTDCADTRDQPLAHSAVCLRKLASAQSFTKHLPMAGFVAAFKSAGANR